jgi:hypothetical protein
MILLIINGLTGNCCPDPAHCCSLFAQNKAISAVFGVLQVAEIEWGFAEVYFYLVDIQ